MTVNRTRLAAGVFVALTLGAPSAQAQIKKVGNGYQFRLKLTPGETTKYNVSIKQAASAGQGLSVVLPFKQTTGKISGGVGTINATVGPPVLNGGQPLGEARKITMKINTRGQLVGGTGSSQGITVFPANPILPGATWKATVPVESFGGSSTNADATYRFIRMTSVNGKPAAELAVTLTSNRGGQINGSGRNFISAADGSLLKSSLSMTFSGAQQGAAPMKFNVAITRA